MNPRVKRMSDRIQSVIDEASKVLSTSRSNNFGEWIDDNVLLNEWVIKSLNIISMIFGESSLQYKEVRKTVDSNVYDSNHVKKLLGMLKGCKDDLDNGFVIGQEFIIAGEIFDNVIEEAKHLLYTNHKDASAVLARVVLEDSLKRIARNNSVDDNQKAAKINDELKKESIYSQPQWRLIQAWLDIGNSAAHGKFDEYTLDDVKNMLAGIEQFLASESFR